MGETEQGTIAVMPQGRRRKARWNQLLQLSSTVLRFRQSLEEEGEGHHATTLDDSDVVEYDESPSGLHPREYHERGPEDKTTSREIQQGLRLSECVAISESTVVCRRWSCIYELFDSRVSLSWRWSDYWRGGKGGRRWYSRLSTVSP
ncbi:hypothetical protein PFISCL1PPCAC_28710 [Pristionchus fissidentatus]|uniref:Uncharacterized protein n=1 Tax=Pristionchus fissidentatus TaxID=1538716 RepID=A0AAV5WDQ4_9BILA|nr:hypothetical protein PFISCL1PPCAC_21451 [Pristionchus fissidentatus]GMT37413.1 hypothetical protein PFISCL1PPCAC_28710 [Pristionchus fissidentatus]